jgi:hypothetical protein
MRVLYVKTTIQTPVLYPETIHLSGYTTYGNYIPCTSTENYGAYAFSYYEKMSSAVDTCDYAG